MNANEFFELSFQLSKKEIFRVSYTSLHGQTPHFATSGGVFNQPKTDWNTCGQCQEEFKNHTAAYKFYKKWDILHLKDLTNEQYTELIADIETLKQKYNFINSQRFNDLKEFSKQTPKKYAPTPLTH